jgi:hypothetical protein
MKRRPEFDGTSCRGVMAGRLNRSLKIDPEVMWEIAVHLPSLDPTIRKMLADLG